MLYKSHLPLTLYESHLFYIIPHKPHRPLITSCCTNLICFVLPHTHTAQISFARNYFMLYESHLPLIASCCTNLICFVLPHSAETSFAFSLKPILNWVNVSSRTYLEVFSKASWFLIGRTFLHEPSWKYSSKLYSGSKKLRSTCSGNICPIRQSMPLIGWEQSSPVDEEKIYIKMDDGVARFFTHFGGSLFICWLVGGATLSRRPRMR